MKIKTKNHKVHATEQEADGVYFLKIVMYLIIGSQWLYIGNGSGNTIVILPVGLIIGASFALHDHFNIDRKIEFAVILVAALIGFYAKVGVTLLT